MPRFEVGLKVLVGFEVEVEAFDRQEAEDLALAMVKEQYRLDQNYSLYEIDIRYSKVKVCIPKTSSPQGFVQKLKTLLKLNLLRRSGSSTEEWKSNRK